MKNVFRLTEGVLQSKKNEFNDDYKEQEHKKIAHVYVTLFKITHTQKKQQQPV